VSPPTPAVHDTPASVSSDSGAPPRPAPTPYAAPEQELDMRPEYDARATVFYELLSDLGAGPDHPPEDSEKQRKAARVGAKRRLAVIVRNDPDLMLEDAATEAEYLLAELFALGPLTELLGDDDVREVVLRSPQLLLVDRGQGRERLARGFSCASAVMMALQRFAGGHLQWDASAPWLDLWLADGTHLRGADVSVAPEGPVVVITRPPRVGGGGLSQVRAVSSALADYLRASLRGRGNLLICLGDHCDGGELLSGLAHELGQIDAAALGIVRAGSPMLTPPGALVLDAEPGRTAGPIQLAVDAGSTRLLIHRADGSGLASAWARRTSWGREPEAARSGQANGAGAGVGVEQLVLALAATDPEAALATCVEGLLLGGFARDREALRRLVAASMDVVVVLGRTARGEQVLTSLGEFDEQGRVSPILSRSSPDARWQHHREPRFVAELARRGVTFDAAKLAGLAGT
jgi:Flp pilus assembly CpaF family ATPase